MRLRLLVIAIWVSLCLFSGAQQVLAESGGATAEVKAVLNRAMDIQTKPELSGETHRKERARLVRQLIAESFLSEDMARESISGQWDKLSQNQRKEFRDLFATLFQDSYTRMVLNFLQKETIEYREESAESRGMFVRTVIMRANEHIPVDYHLVQKNKKWLIRDVDIDGVSIIDNYKSSFNRVIQKGSFESLLQKMRIQRQAISDDAVS